MLGDGTPGVLDLLLLIGTSLLAVPELPRTPAHGPWSCASMLPLLCDPWLAQTSWYPCCNCVGGCIVCCCGRIHFVEGVPESGAFLGGVVRMWTACRQPAMAPLVTMAPTRSLLHATPGRTLHSRTFVGSSMDCCSAGISSFVCYVVAGVLCGVSRPAHCQVFPSCNHSPKDR